MSKKAILFGVSFCVIGLLSWNLVYPIVSFLSTNLGVRESFYLSRGIDFGNYVAAQRRYKDHVMRFELGSIIRSFSRLLHIDYEKTDYAEESRVVSILYDLSKKPFSYKRETALYIPKTLDTYWSMSPDTHASPFIAPAITAMAMIEGLPFDRPSFYTHKLEYGYYDYHLANKRADVLRMTPEQICSKANEEGFKRIVEITQNSKFQIITNSYNCSETFSMNKSINSK